MNFITFDFLVFIIIAFTIYWSLNKNLRWQNVFILVANYVFYGWWDYRFLLLILGCALIDYGIGINMYNAKPGKKIYFLLSSLILNLGVLFFFKYYNFFVNSLQITLQNAGVHTNLHSLNIILPIGLSFFTFQTLSYAIDIYKGKIKPTTDIVVFLSFTSFFPQLLAGPIERAAQLIPQLCRKRVFDYAQVTDGLRQITYGVFKKMVIADHLDLRVNVIFANYKYASSSELILGGIFFIVQLYADFSGYSDIAIGTGKLFGFKLMTNFKTPFFAKTVPEFWSRWHISLTSWFRDYVYLPLVRRGRDNTLWRITATFILFTLIGLWHGANYTFICFGLCHGIYFIPSVLSKRMPPLKRALNYLKTNEVFSKLSVVVVFLLLSFSSIFFRAPDIGTAFNYFGRIFTQPIHMPGSYFTKWIPLILIFLGFEYFRQNYSYPFEISGFPKLYRRALQLTALALILLCGYYGTAAFYYFKF